MWDKTHYNNDSKFEILIYNNANGDEPFYDFFVSLNREMQAKIIKAIDELQIKGNEIRYPYSKKIFDGIFELRIKQANNIVRVFYFFYYEKKIVLLNGFVKKTNKLPKQELNKAIRYRNDWLRRNKYDIWTVKKRIFIRF